MKIPRARPLADTDEEAVRATIISKLESDPERYLGDYARRFGNVLNADDAATLFSEYGENPAKYRVAVHPAAQWIRDELFRRALNTSGSDQFRVVFTAGGNAAGKSTAVAFSGTDSDSAAAVLDSTFSNYEHARVLVDQAASAGKRVTVLYVNRPLDDALMSMLDRAGTEGRVVTLNQLIESQRGAAGTVRKLWGTLGGRPGFTFRFLMNAPDGLREGGVDVAQPAAYTGSRDALDRILDAEYQAGRIPEAIYRRVKGRS